MFVLLGGGLSHASIVPFFQRDRSIDEIQRALNKLPEEGRRRTKARLYSEMGNLFYRSGRFIEAAEAYRASLRHNGGKKLKRHTYLYLAKSEESAGRFDEAIAAYRQSIKYDKRNWKRYRDLAWVYEQVQNYRMAIDFYESALQRNDGEGALYFAVGRVWHRLGMLQRAESFLMTSKKKGVSSMSLALELSLVYEEMGRFNDAAVAFEKSLHAASPPADWARFVYLSILARNNAFANKGLSVLREKGLPDQTWEFYESLVHAAGEPFGRILELSKTDASVRYLLNYVSQ